MPCRRRPVPDCASAGLADDPHRAAVRVVRIVGVAVEHRQRHFGQLDRHAEEADDPHPEHGARPAKRDGQRDAADVAEADRRRQRRRQGLEVIDRAGIVRVVVLAADHVIAVGQRAVLAEAAPDREQYAGARAAVNSTALCQMIAFSVSSIVLPGTFFVILGPPESGRHYFSTMAVTPMPPAVQTEIRPRPEPRSSSMLRQRRRECGRRLPRTDGPIAMLPPLMFSLSRSMRPERFGAAEPFAAVLRRFPGLQRRERLGGEGFVDFEQIEVGEDRAGHRPACSRPSMPVPSAGLRTCGRNRRRRPCRSAGMAWIGSPRCRGPVFGRQQHAGGAVGQRRAVARPSSCLPGRDRKPVSAARVSRASYRAACCCLRSRR